MLVRSIAAVLAVLLQAAPTIPDYKAPDVVHLTAKTLRVYEAPEADQGVAADKRFFYPIDNTVVAKYEIATGKFVHRWIGPRNGLIRHLNSCLVDGRRLWCANSNYSQTPMGSSIEVFDANTLVHVETHSLGMMDEGSLTFFDRYRDGWIAGFAHYDATGGVAFKNHTFSSVVTFDASWRRTGGWLFPESALARMAPHAASGGAIGPDGWLYLLGHDRPEMYVVGRPPMGPTLMHVATIDLDAEGQAFAWAQDGSRTVFAIDRRKGLVRTIEIPRIVPAARGFSWPSTVKVIGNQLTFQSPPWHSRGSWIWSAFGRSPRLLVRFSWCRWYAARRAG